MARKRYSQEKKVALVREWERAGVSASAFCRKRRINYQSFLRWRAEVVADGAGERPLTEFVELEVGAPRGRAGGKPETTVVELTLGTQAVLRIFTGGDCKE